MEKIVQIFKHINQMVNDGTKDVIACTSIMT